LISRCSLTGAVCPCFPVTAQTVCHLVYGILLSVPLNFPPPHTSSIQHFNAKCYHRRVTIALSNVQLRSEILEHPVILIRITYVRQFVGRWRISPCCICGTVTSGSRSFWLSRAASCGKVICSTLRSTVPRLVDRRSASLPGRFLSLLAHRWPGSASLSFRRASRHLISRTSCEASNERPLFRTEPGRVSCSGILSDMPRVRGGRYRNMTTRITQNPFEEGLSPCSHPKGL
jgi:hypothetical protein